LSAVLYIVFLRNPRAGLIAVNGGNRSGGNCWGNGRWTSIHGQSPANDRRRGRNDHLILYRDRLAMLWLLFVASAYCAYTVVCRSSLYT